MNFGATFSLGAGAFGTLAFMNPWVLGGLLFLPALWFLLRVTPPAPRRITFPATRFLNDIKPQEQTTSRTPWWILLLRIVILSLIITALAHPVLNPASPVAGTGAIRIVMDNSWPSAQNWQQQTDEARRIIQSAGRDGREIYILTTAPEPGQEKPALYGPLTHAQADSTLRGLAPLPWPADYDAMARTITEQTGQKSYHSIWLSHGLKEGSGAILNTLQNQGRLTFIRPDNSSLPVLLRPARGSADKTAITISGAQALPSALPLRIQAIGRGGRVIDSRDITPDLRNRDVDIDLDLPPSLRGQVQQIRLDGIAGAGGVVILDDSQRRRDVGIYTTSRADDAEAPLIEETYYIHRALTPYANLSSGTFEELVDAGLSVIIAPNVGAMTPDTLNLLERWVKEGGLLLRFAGPNMMEGQHFLTPVRLREGGRAMDGSLTWDKPLTLAPFPDTSPLYGISTSDEITVRRQILAVPEPGLSQKSWATLEDGTPLITADRLGNGMLVMVHTTATPLWTDLPLSGAFVQILQRIVQMAGTQGSTQQQTGGTLQPLAVLDGYGNIVQPAAFDEPIPAQNFSRARVDSKHPPGIYGRAGYQDVLHLGAHAPRPEAFTSLPAGVTRLTYGTQNETDLARWLLLAAFLLFCLDWLLMVMMQMRLRITGWRYAGAIVLFGLSMVVLSPVAAASADHVRYADNIHLAFIPTGDTAIDALTRQGLEQLAAILKRRTSVEPSGVVSINPETDELTLFPVIYWPIGGHEQTLDSRALSNIQHYIDNGGLLLIDTRDRNVAPASPAATTQNTRRLRQLLGGLDVAPLQPIGEDHVLKRSFYLLPDDLPGRYSGGTVWVEEDTISGRDGVSSLIIGGHDWAAAWAGQSRAGGTRAPGTARQQEMSYRFGVNLMMYALTGNYKTDQVHIPHILERLGQ